ncbi:hypothetical protein [Celeribacter indicus]|uniref:CYTH domain-containing protein n=1 Tax=Celeribacter indicus TaxID=1208324 RepID=A0A0B5E046_9RHOB|nr:hypothetical protein [Celeribacter indicus]AJE49073.1 hypothetical protein P73_4358 [Celeribacter indicus]SDW45215.1 hypothetical protein SAMN05443573_103283 [Celeribacter indicus]
MSRVEFRIFEQDSAALRRRIDARFELCGRDHRTDIYLLRDPGTSALKLRDGVELDLKVLLGREGDFERWAPRGRVRLPATGVEITGALDAPEALPPFEPMEVHDAAAFVEAFRREGYRAFRLHKARAQYRAPGGLVETVAIEGDIGIPGASGIDSIALEGEDVSALEQVREELGLSGRENRSYPAWLLAQKKV